MPAVDVHMKGERGLTAEQIAVERGHGDVALLLKFARQNGAMVTPRGPHHAPSSSSSFTPLPTVGLVSPAAAVHTGGNDALSAPDGVSAQSAQTSTKGQRSLNSRSAMRKSSNGANMPSVTLV